MDEKELQLKILAISGILGAFRHNDVKPDVELVKILKYAEKAIEISNDMENDGDGGEEYLNALLNELIDEVI